MKEVDTAESEVTTEGHVGEDEDLVEIDSLNEGESS